MAIRRYKLEQIVNLLPQPKLVAPTTTSPAEPNRSVPPAAKSAFHPFRSVASSRPANRELREPD
jgi:hypothetical protein